MFSFRHLATVLMLTPALAYPAPAGTAPAHNFDDRIGAANLLYRTAAGTAYVRTYAPAVAAAIQACIPPGTKSATTLGNFIFVADVTAAGLVTGGAVQPPTAVSQCFAAQFAQSRLPPPPLPAGAKINYPIVVELNVTP